MEDCRDRGGRILRRGRPVVLGMADRRFIRRPQLGARDPVAALPLSRRLVRVGTPRARLLVESMRHCHAQHPFQSPLSRPFQRTSAIPKTWMPRRTPPCAQKLTTDELEYPWAGPFEHDATGNQSQQRDTKALAPHRLEARSFGASTVQVAGWSLSI